MIIHLAEKLIQAEYFKHLQQILNRFPDKEIILFTDNFPTHTNSAADTFYKSHPRLILVFMPKYSPKLNIIESIWKELKNVVGNWFYSTIIEMERAIRKFFRSLCYDKQKVITLAALNEKYLI